MKTCKDCLHYDGCHLEKTETRYENSGCSAFTDKSDWVHLPCKVGDKVWYLRKGKVYWRFVSKSSIYSIATKGKFGKSVFLTREEAEKALKERQGEQ